MKLLSVDSHYDEVRDMKSLAAPAVSSEGFLLLDSSMNPVFVNAVAVQILVYPEKPETRENLKSYIAGRVRSILFAGAAGSAIRPKLQSGRRTYLCRSFPVTGMSKGGSQASLAVMLERVKTRPASLAQLSERFHLTSRELQVAGFLLQGLTSKQIGERMQISPNTVKSFLRLIMVKMGVSTRSAIVGKALPMEF